MIPFLGTNFLFDVPFLSFFSFQISFQTLRHSLLDPIWEVRHGAALGLAEMALCIQPKETTDATAAAAAAEMSSSQPMSSTFQSIASDLTVRCLCVLALDRFSDYSLDLLVSPSQETAGQLISILVRITV